MTAKNQQYDRTGGKLLRDINKYFVKRGRTTVAKGLDWKTALDIAQNGFGLDIYTGPFGRVRVAYTPPKRRR